MNVGDTINRDQARQLPVGAKFTDLDGTRARTVTGHGYTRDGQGYQREWTGLPTRNFTITHLPDQPGAEFTIGQRVDQDVVRRLPTGAVWNGEDGRPRSIIEQGRTYRDPDGYTQRLDAWHGRNGTLVSLPERPEGGPQVGDVIDGNTAEGKARLRALPEGTDTQVVDNDRHYVKSGDRMEQIGGNNNVVNIADFIGRVRVVWMPGMKKQAYTKHAVGQTGIDGTELRDLPEGAVIRGDQDRRQRTIIKDGYRTDDGPFAGREFPMERLTGPYTLLSLPEQPEVKAAHGFTVGQEIPAAELGTLPVGTTFRAVGGTEDYLTVEGGDDRRAVGGPVTHFVRPGQGIVNGGGLYPLAELRGNFTITDLPEKPETLAEFKARVWRVTRPYANSDYTGARTNDLLRRLGVTEPAVEDPDAVQKFKDEMWNLIAGQAKDEGWCATWKKPLAELGVTEPKPKTVTTTITISHDPTQADVEHLRGHVTGLAGVESVEVS